MVETLTEWARYSELMTGAVLKTHRYLPVLFVHCSLRSSPDDSDPDASAPSRPSAESATGGRGTSDAEPAEQQQEEVAIEVPHVVPPDGGWGWVIVAASFMCNAIVDGFIFSFGILLLLLINEFGQSKSKTAWIGSILSGFYLIAG